MKILLTAVNAKFIHSSLAVKCLYKYSKKYKDNLAMSEFTINQSKDFILRQIFLEKADVVCFSCYLWNIDIVLSVVENLKKISPRTIIVLGGPEVSYDAEKVLKTNEFVDIVIRGEGEATFKDISEYFILKNKDLPEIDGITYRNNDEIISNPNRQGICLDDLEFVYDNLDGYENKIIYYETQRGCPYNCQYCLSSIEKGVRFLSAERVKRDLQFFLDNNVKQVKFVDRTFNCDKNHALMIWKYLIENDNGTTNFHMEITADIMDDEIIDALKNARKGLFQFEIGVQSTNEDTIEAIKRNTDFNKLKVVVNKIKNLGNIHQHLDLIAGLPYEDYKSFGKSFDDVYSLEPEQLQMGFLKLLKGSGLRNDADKYGIKFRREAVYEFLETNWLSYEENEKLKDIEEMLETYYNSGKAVNTIKYIMGFFKSPFAFFEKLAEYWVNQGHNFVQHSKMELYEILYYFCIQSDGLRDKAEVIKCFLRFDIYTLDNIKNIPQIISDLDRDLNKDNIKAFFNNKDNIEKYLPKLAEYTSQQLMRMCHVEIFDYDIIDFLQSGKQAEHCKTAVLFDYYGDKTGFGDINYQKIEI